jgi:hypothetical protein
MPLPLLAISASYAPAVNRSGRLLVPNGRAATNVDRAFDANQAQLAKSILWRLVEQALAEVDQGDRGGVCAVGVSDPSAADHSRRRVAEPSSLMALSLTGRRSTALIRR